MDAFGTATSEQSLWRPIKEASAFESTVQRLAQAIKLGVVTHGERLPPERELAERLHVSRGTLREAIKALRLAGFVVSTPGRSGGTFVTYTAVTTDTLSTPAANTGHSGELADELQDLLILREALEPSAAAAAANRSLPPGDRAHLNNCLEQAAERTSLARRVNDSRLHLAIAAATGSPSLTSAVADAQLRLDAVLARIPVMERNLDTSDTQHREVVAAILAGDAEGARTCMQQHCRSTGLLLESLLT